MAARSILLFTDDLRLADNPAVAAAALDGETLPVVVEDPEEHALWAPGHAQSAWLACSLDRLDASLRQRGSRLLRLRGPAPQLVTELARSTGATVVHRSVRRWPDHVEADRTLDRALSAAGIAVRTGDAQLLHEPGEVLTAAGGPYTVFTPFARRVARELRTGTLSEAPRAIRTPETPADDGPARPAAAPPPGGWEPGEAGALAALERFAECCLADYATARDLPGTDGTSRLSAHLRHGEISPARVWERLAPLPGAEPFLRQLLWREFAYDLLVHFPHTVSAPLHERFAAFPWSRDFEGLAAWQRGETGFPIVDAGMRQLAATGWMHNRVRMLTASFLVKDLLLPWQQGAAWFWRGLVDADMANNTLGWQWIAGSGADAAPYVRVFNPSLQGMRFDAHGAYVRRWLPELSGMPDAWIHRPGAAPADVLRAAGVRIGADYPAPILDHAEARARALAVFEMMRRATP